MEEAEATQVNLNFSSPAESIYGDTAVDMVIIPGVSGDYGVTAGHTPTISELRPGLVEIFHKEGDASEKYFISGGFAFTHTNSTTDISAADVVSLEDLDAAEARKNLNAFRSAESGAAEDTPEKAAALIGVNVNEAILVALGETI
jgi:F0F1-type ATP synthase epsilon subunit|eukprot:Stramenopile-MAST_4_protein_2498